MNAYGETELLYSDVTPHVCPANSAENVLATISIKPRQVRPGDRLRIAVSAPLTSSANTKTVRVRIGSVAGTAVLTGSATSSNALHAVAELVALSNTALYSPVPASPAGSGASGTAPAEAVVDLTSGFDLVVTGQHNGSEAFTVKAILVDIVRAP